MIVTNAVFDRDYWLDKISKGEVSKADMAYIDKEGDIYARSMLSVLRDKIKQAKALEVAAANPHKIDPEQAMFARIHNGQLNDQEIMKILKDGGKFEKALNEKVAKEWENKQHFKKDWGNSFDGVDNDGNLYKDMTLEEFFNS